MIETPPGRIPVQNTIKRRKSYAVTSLLVAAVLVLTRNDAAAVINQFWAGPSGTTNAPVSGTWTNGVGTGTNWSDGTSASGNSTWTNGNSAVFAGADGAYGIKVGGAITVGSVSFLASGYTLTNNTAQTITLTNSSGRESLNPGVNVTIGTNVNLTSVQTVTFGPSGNAVGGTVTLANGATINETSSGRTLAVDGVGTLISVQTGAAFKISSAGAGTETFSLGAGGNSSNTVSIDGGTMSAAGSAAVINVGSGSGAVGVLTVNAGGVTLAGSAGIVLATGSASNGIVNLNGGTVIVPKVSKGTGTNATFNFNGGTLKATNVSTPFLAGLDAANVRNGGAIINDGGLAITIGQALLHSSLNGDNPTDGGLTNLGGGTVTLSGANTYNGPTRVSAGTLVTTTASTGGGSYTVANGATLEVQVNTAGTSLTNSSLTLGTSGATTLTFTLGGNASTTVPAIQENGALTMGGTVTVNVTGSFDTTSSTNLLISYASGGSGAFVIGSVPAATGGAAATLINAGNRLMLIYAQPAQAVKWAVGNGNWDTTTLNWQLLGGSGATNYVETSPVTFDDSASGSSPITVTLTDNRSPTSITNNSTKNYTIAGGFSLNTGGTLDKSGSGTLTMTVNSTIAGGVAIHAGTLQFGNGGTNGSLGVANIANDGTLTFNRSDVITVAGTISGAGNAVNNGTGTVALTGTNTYSGTTTVNSGKLSVLSASSGGGSFTVADGATLEVQAVNMSSYLQISGLTLGTSGQLTNNFALGNARTPTFPLVYVTGDVNLNGTVVVNATGSGMAAGTYVLLKYDGNLNGSGTFVAGGFPGVWTLINDTANKQLIITGTPGLVWDSGNTNNGSVIDAASGTWDLTAGNTVWNNAGANVAYANGNNALFSGADGAYGIKVASAISAPIVQFLSGGYTLTNDTPQTITLGGTSTTVPKLVVAAGKTNTIGTNITVSTSSTSYLGNVGNTPGGTLIIDNGGLVVLTTANTFGLDGAGTVVSIKTGGVMRDLAGSTTGQIAIGANNTGNAPTISVDGGTLEILGVGGALTVGNGSGTVAGILTLNGGSVNMPGGTTKALNLGANAGNVGTLNLNGGVLNVAEIIKGNASAFATNNFNGGTVRAVNATFASSFLSGLDCANVRNGGLIFDDGGFAITIGQQLQHSTISGDNTTDGGLTKLGSGTLTLTSANTYNGVTTVSNGTLLVSGSILTNATVAGGTLGGTGTIGGSVTVAAAGTLAPGAVDTGTLTINGNLTLQGNFAAVVNESISPSNNLCVVSGTLTNIGTGTVTVTNAGPALALGDSFKLFSQPMVGGGALTITPAPGAGLSWQNKLAVDGSIVVVSAVASYPTNITVAVSGNALTLTWPATHLGWIAQSNSVALADTNFWFDIPGSASVTSLTNTINPNLLNVFYRLRHP
jgi:fibronectin-binding autotransporter adhesin